MIYNYQQTYKTGSITEISDSYVIRLPDQANIPNDLNNTDWQVYQEWLAIGNTPLTPEGN